MAPRSRAPRPSIGASLSSSFQVPPSAQLDSRATFFQILTVQSLHYLTLSILIPPFLSLFPSISLPALLFEGGPAQVGMVLDWRELGARTTFDWSPLGEDFLTWRKGVDKEVLLGGLDEGDRAVAGGWRMGDVWLGDVLPEGAEGRRPVLLDVDKILRYGDVLPPTAALQGQGQGQVPQAQPAAGQTVDAEAQEEMADVKASASSKAEGDVEQWEWKIARDPSRGWAIAAAWVVACGVDVFLLTTVVRRPKHILDHVVTLHLVHLLLTSWYSSSIPTSLFWWGCMLAHATGAVLLAERVAIRREMGSEVGYGLVGSGREDEEEAMPASGGTGGANGQAAAPHVLFDEEAERNDEEDEDGDEQSQLVRKPFMAAPSSFFGRGGGGGGSGGANGHGKAGDEIAMKPLKKEER